MIIVRITMNALLEKRTEVMQTLLSMIEPTEKERGCLRCHIFRDIEDKNGFGLIVEWETRKDLDDYIKSDRFGVLLGTKRLQKNSVILTNAAIAIIIIVASLTIGFKAYALIQFPVIFIAGVIGVWLFYIQHQFEGVYWSRQDQWNPEKASLFGSSYYKLPKAIQWFTGNIGLHHIHHLRARIPNYNLQRAYEETKALVDVEPLTLRKSITCLRLKLWDEKRQKLVGFKSVYA